MMSTGLSRLLFAIGCGFVLAMTIANVDKVASPRELEQYHATAYKNPETFAHDDFAACFLSSTNDIIPVLIARTNDVQKMVIYYIGYIITILLLFKVAQFLKMGAATALVVPLMILYAPWNSFGFNTVFFKVEFMGMVLAGPFLAGCLLFFLKERYGWSGLFAGAGFYLHPGAILWLLIAMFSFLPVALIFNRCVDGDRRLDLKRFIGGLGLFTAIFALAAWPRLKTLFMTGHSATFLDTQFSYDLLRYIWRGQTSLWLDFVFESNRLIAVIPWAGFVLFLLINGFSFWNTKDKTTRLVLYMYLGSAAFLIINEILINMFDFRIAAVYGLCRSSGFNFLFCVLLAAANIRDCSLAKKYIELGSWLGFLLMFFMVHYTLGAISQLIWLVMILGIKIADKFWNVEERAGALISKNSFVLRQTAKVASLLLLAAVIGISAVKIPKKMRNISHRKDDPYYQAIEYVNAHNPTDGTVLYPFTKEDKYFLYSRTPGFFTSYYVVVLIPLYQFDAVVQRRAFDKFHALENEFGIDTWAKIKKDPVHYKDAWEKAWETKVNSNFIERWAKHDNIRYIIRESNLSALPYKVEYQNEEFTVYRR